MQQLPFLVAEPPRLSPIITPMGSHMLQPVLLLGNTLGKDKLKIYLVLENSHSPPLRTYERSCENLLCIQRAKQKTQSNLYCQTGQQ